MHLGWVRIPGLWNLEAEVAHGGSGWILKARQACKILL